MNKTRCPYFLYTSTMIVEEGAPLCELTDTPCIEELGEHCEALELIEEEE